MAPRLPPVAVAFLAGAAVMTVELLIPRLSARHLGTSAEVWTALFAVVLGGIALGNALGGRLADARPGRAADGRVLLLAAALVAAIPFLDGVAERAFASLPLLPRTILSMLVCALAPTTALGAVSPLLTADALARTRHPGRTLGALAAAGSAGSVLGTYVTGFAAIPRLDVVHAIYGCAGVLALLGAARLPRTATPPAAPVVPPPASGERGAVPATLSFSRAVVLVVLAGVVLLLVEAIAGRVASRFVGNGIYTWTAVIGAVLLGVAAGSALGGRLADRRGARRVLPFVLLAASLLTASAIWTPSLLSALSRAPGDSFPLRVALGALLAWVLPSAAFGAIPPIVARASLRGDGNDGRRIGLLYAANTVGAVLGSILTGPFLVPAVGVPAALLVAAIALAAAPVLLGARPELPWIGGLVAVLLAAVLPLDAARRAGSTLGVREDLDVILVLESRYGNVRVQSLDGTEYAVPGRPRARSLVLDGLVHGIVDLDDPTWLGYGYEGVYAAITDRLVPRDRLARALFLGGGTYSFPTRLLATHPSATADVAEIDPVVTRACREALGLVDRPGLSIHHEDARTFVRDLAPGAPAYDLVFGDAFADVSVPFHLTTLEFARAIEARLAPSGAYLINVIDSRSSGAFVGAFVTTLRQVFPSVVVFSPDAVEQTRDTFVVVASKAPLPLDGLERDDSLAAAPARRIPVHRFSETEVAAFEARGGHRVLTDTRAPVEALLAPTVRRRAGR